MVVLGAIGPGVGILSIGLAARAAASALNRLFEAAVPVIQEERGSGRPERNVELSGCAEAVVERAGVTLKGKGQPVRVYTLRTDLGPIS
jgi:hypothetical protein